jgi:gephyrin
MASPPPPPAGVATPSAGFRMLAVPEAVALILAHTAPLGDEEVALAAAVGRTLAADVVAAEPVPGYRASIKDGYAVASADGPGEYAVVAEAHAGAPPAALPRGAVAYVATGGALPEGADAVVQIEDVLTLAPRGGAAPWRVRVRAAVPPGHDVRAVGSDVAAGEVALAAGARVGAAEVGVLATVGAARVRVKRVPRVAVLSTGDEIVDPAATGPPPPGAARDANRPMLLAAAAAAGAATVDLGIVGDGAAAAEAALDAALAAGADVLLTSGGVSMGHRDAVKPLLARRGEILFGKVLMKPGKPLTFALVPRTGGAAGGATGAAGASAPPPPLLVFGLPGNPASAYVTFHLAVVPCLRRLAGWADPALRRVHCRLDFAARLDPERPEYHRASARWAARADGVPGGELVAASTGGQISSRVLSLRSANVLLEVPRGSGALEAGTVLPALVVGDLGAMPQIAM